MFCLSLFFFFQAEDGIRDLYVTGVQTCALPIFGDEVVRCEFLGGLWEVTTAAGHRDRFDVVIAATGVLHHPNIPRFEGIDSFAGAAFHSARWDHSVSLDGKRIGVIGVGSTAAQITAALVPRAAKFSL